MAYPVVVDQLVGLHLVLCLDGWLAVSLHSVVITGDKRQDKSTKLKETYRVYKNTIILLLLTTHICVKICIPLITFHTWMVIRGMEKLEWVLNEGADHHTTVH